MSQGKKRTRITALFISLAVIVLLILAGKTAAVRPYLSGIENGFRNVLAPIQVGAMVVYDKFSAIPDYFGGIERLKTQKNELYDEIYRLTNEVTSLTEAKEENERLKDLLNIYDTVNKEWTPVVTDVIGRESASWYRTITIRGGEDKGFKKDMPAINGQGLIGRIVNVGKTSSDVVLISDAYGAVGAMVQNTRTVGVVEGKDGASDELYLIHVPYDAEIELYQTVISSGLGGIYPKGLRIGYITDMETESGGLMLKCTVKSFVDFNKLEEVMVLTPKIAEGGA
ncbi:MAG: rod shape-determining protein MreC [Clostridia bacterium]|nr:rod shape-determining protein MreC [Clostridia bacterium]